MDLHRHKSDLSIRIGFLLLLSLSRIPLALAESETIQADYAYPSGGSGAPKVLSGGEAITVDLPPLASREKVPVSPSLKGMRKTPASTLTFQGQNQAPSSDGGFVYKPPDTHAAVGPGSGASGRVVEVTNSGVTIFEKTGATVASRMDLDAFLGIGSVGSPNGTFDPKVLFDQHSNRFFVVILQGKMTPNSGGSGGLSNVHIVVSDNAVPGNLTTDWSFFSGSGLTDFAGDGMGPGPGGVYETWFDYPGIGADATRLVVTGNMFDGDDSFRGAKIRVYDKALLLAGNQSYTDFDIDATVTLGVFTIQPCHVYGTTKNGDFYLINRFGQSAYRLWQITGSAESPSLLEGSYTSLRGWTGGAQIVIGAPQRAAGGGTSAFTIDTLSSRVLDAKYRNIGGTESVWCCLSADSDVDGRTEGVWFEIDPNVTGSVSPGVVTTPSVRQSGFVNGGSLESWAFLPSIASNARGDAMVCFSESSPANFVEMRAAARHGSDSPDTIQSSVLVATSAGEYDDFGSSLNERWGDYSACVVDPDDDATFWIANEVVHVGRSIGDDARWGTRIARMGATLASGAPTPTATLPNSPTPTPPNTPTFTWTVAATLTPSPSNTPADTHVPTETVTPVTSATSIPPHSPTSTATPTAQGGTPTETASPTVDGSIPTSTAIPSPTLLETPTLTPTGEGAAISPTAVAPLDPKKLLDLIRDMSKGSASSRDLLIRSAYWLLEE